MTRCTRLLHNMVHLTSTLLTLLVDGVHVLWLCLRPSAELAAENLLLRKQLPCYQERQGKPRRATNVTRFALVGLSRWFNWRQALAIVQPATFLRWHRQGFWLFYDTMPAEHPYRFLSMTETAFSRRSSTRASATWLPLRIREFFTVGRQEGDRRVLCSHRLILIKT
jgi:hypothetical protein